MNQIIKVTKQEIGNAELNSVNAREVYEYLEVKTVFANWIRRAIEKYEFRENVEYVTFISDSKSGKREYIVTLEMAKELAMLENNPKGKETRKYFINCEKQLIEQSQNIHPVMLDIMQQNKEIQLATQKTNEALLKVTTALVDVSKTLSSITEKMNTVDKKVEEIEKKTSYTAEISIRADKVLGKTYNYLKYQPMTHEERKRLNEKIKERGKILSKQHSLDIEVATSSIYRLLNKQYGLSSYHELEHKDILSALDWVEFCELGNWEGESTLKDPLDDVYPDTQRTNARNIYGDRFMD